MAGRRGGTKTMSIRELQVRVPQRPTPIWGDRVVICKRTFNFAPKDSVGKEGGVSRDGVMYSK